MSIIDRMNFTSDTFRAKLLESNDALMAIPAKRTTTLRFTVDELNPDMKDILGLDWSAERERILQWAQGLLNRFEYKPGWVFTLHRYAEQGDSVRLEVAFMAPDSRHPRSDKNFPITGVFDIPENVYREFSDADFWVWLHRVIEFVERHEMDEWFKIDGKMMTDPHANGRVFRG